MLKLQGIPLRHYSAMFGKILIVYFAINGVSWLVLVSSAIPIYLNNQQALNYHEGVISPYLVLSVVLSTVLSAIYLILEKKGAESYLWFYFLLAPFFLVSSFVIRNVTDPISLWFIYATAVFIYIVASLLLAKRKESLKKLMFVFGFIGLCYVLVDLYNWMNSKDIRLTTGTEKISQDFLVTNGFVGKPNIYHFILDEYQSDMFDLTLSGSSADDLSGFYYFKNTTTLFGRTEMSLASTFLGHSYDFIEDPIDYQSRAFSSEDSLFYWVRNSGYKISAYIHPVFSFELKNFDNIQYHENLPSEYNPIFESYFNKLWAYSITPDFISKRLMSPDEYLKLESQNLLTAAAPIKSLRTMQDIIENEKNLSAEGRYTFVHLILPHFPYVLNADCSFSIEGETSSPLAQARCANKLMREFIGKLKQQDRFDSSMIIIHSDHGARFVLEDGMLKDVEHEGLYSERWSLARARSLLLIKPPGRGADTPLITSDADVSLIDIAPSILESMNIDNSMRMDGRNIVSPPLFKNREERDYYFYDKENYSGSPGIFNITHFRIKEMEIRKVGINEFLKVQ